MNQLQFQCTEKVRNQRSHMRTYSSQVFRFFSDDKDPQKISKAKEQKQTKKTTTKIFCRYPKFALNSCVTVLYAS